MFIIKREYKFFLFSIRTNTRYKYSVIGHPNKLSIITSRDYILLIANILRLDNKFRNTIFPAFLNSALILLDSYAIIAPVFR